MKLYYFEDPNGNFGDDLNPWLWSRLLPGVLDEKEDQRFVGIGTLLNLRLPPAPIKHIFGSGLGYGEPPNVDHTYVFHAVRGHETAKALNLPEEKVITDAAVLIRAVPLPRVEKAYSFGFMPTGHSIANYDWESLCAMLGLRYISCHWDVDRVLQEILQCEILISEAMHGAIVADALRVPWIPVDCYDYVLDFKWQDWLSSLKMDYRPSHLTPLYGPAGESFEDKLKVSLKRSLQSVGIWSSAWSEPPPVESSPEVRERVLEELVAVSKRSPFLSDETLIETHTQRYLELLEAFKKHCSG